MLCIVVWIPASAGNDGGDTFLCESASSRLLMLAVALHPSQPPLWIADQVRNDGGPYQSRSEEA